MKTSPEFIANIQMLLAEYTKCGHVGPEWEARKMAICRLETFLFVNVDAILSDLIDFHGIAAKCAPWDGAERRRQERHFDSDEVRDAMRPSCALQSAVDRFSPRDIR